MAAEKPAASSMQRSGTAVAGSGMQPHLGFRSLGSLSGGTGTASTGLDIFGRHDVWLPATPSGPASDGRESSEVNGCE